VYRGCDTHLRVDNTETLTDASKEVGLEIIVGKTKYILLSHNHNAGQNWDIKTANRLFENVSVQIFGNEFDSGGI
jgi:hypothetical protein